MQHYRDVVVPATTKTECTKTTCDLCGEEIKDTAMFNAEEIEVRSRVKRTNIIKHVSGSTYYDSGSTEETGVDMCSDCFDNKLVPWLREQGANPKPVDTSW